VSPPDSTDDSMDILSYVRSRPIQDEVQPSSPRSRRDQFFKYSSIASISHAVKHRRPTSIQDVCEDQGNEKGGEDSPAAEQTRISQSGSPSALVRPMSSPRQKRGNNASERMAFSKFRLKESLSFSTSSTSSMEDRRLKKKPSLMSSSEEMMQEKASITPKMVRKSAYVRSAKKEKGEKIDEMSLFEACVNHDVNECRRLTLAEGCDPQYLYQGDMTIVNGIHIFPGDTPYTIASRYQHKEILQYLVLFVSYLTPEARKTKENFFEDVRYFLLFSCLPLT
jgi:hypothetical protein